MQSPTIRTHTSLGRLVYLLPKSRCFSTSDTVTKSHGAFLRKFMKTGEHETSRSKKRAWVTKPSNLGASQQKGEGNTHRLHVLSKVFLDKITDILSTGEISQFVMGHRMEITKIKVLPQLTGINVYWMCPSADGIEHLEAVLTDNAWKIRHELSQQRVLGKVPPVNFVKDKSQGVFEEVEKRLAVADFGPTLSIEEDISSSDKVLPLPGAVLQNNILGVDVEKIYKKVMQDVRKSKAEHRHIDSINLPVHTYWSPHDFAMRKQEIQKWAKMYSQKKKIATSDRILNDEIMDYNLQFESVPEISFSEDVDYIDDEEDI